MISLNALDAHGCPSATDPSGASKSQLQSQDARQSRGKGDVSGMRKWRIYENVACSIEIAACDVTLWIAELHVALIVCEVKAPAVCNQLRQTHQRRFSSTIFCGQIRGGWLCLRHRSLLRLTLRFPFQQETTVASYRYIFPDERVAVGLDIVCAQIGIWSASIVNATGMT